MKSEIFWLKPQHSKKLASCGRNRRIKRSLFCRCAKCQICKIPWLRKVYVSLNKNDQRLFSLNVPLVSLNKVNFQIYSCEKVLQVRLSKVFSQESPKYFNLCRLVDWLFTEKGNGKLFSFYLVWRPRLFLKTFPQKCLAGLKAIFQTNLTNSFSEKWQILSKIAFFEKWISSSKSQQSLKLAHFSFHLWI